MNNTNDVYYNSDENSYVNQNVITPIQPKSDKLHDIFDSISMCYEKPLIKQTITQTPIHPTIIHNNNTQSKTKQNKKPIKNKQIIDSDDDFDYYND